MDKLITMTESERKPFAWIGRFNDAPPGFREITVEQLAKETHFGSYSPAMVDYKQIHGFETDTQGRSRMIAVHLFVYHDDTGVAIEIDYWGHISKHVRYFAFERCKHEMEHRATLGNCYNSYKCTKCGYAENVDSSD